MFSFSISYKTIWRSSIVFKILHFHIIFFMTILINRAKNRTRLYHRIIGVCLVKVMWDAWNFVLLHFNRFRILKCEIEEIHFNSFVLLKNMQISWCWIISVGSSQFGYRMKRIEIKWAHLLNLNSWNFLFKQYKFALLHHLMLTIIETVYWISFWKFISFYFCIPPTWMCTCSRNLHWLMDFIVKIVKIIKLLVWCCCLKRVSWLAMFPFPVRNFIPLQLEVEKNAVTIAKFEWLHQWQLIMS